MNNKFPFSTSPSPPPLLTPYTHLNLGNMDENCANVFWLFLMIGNQYYFYSNMKNPNKSTQQNPSTPFYKKNMCTKACLFDMFWNTNLYWKWKGSLILWHNSNLHILELVCYFELHHANSQKTFPIPLLVCYISSLVSPK